MLMRRIVLTGMVPVFAVIVLQGGTDADGFNTNWRYRLYARALTYVDPDDTSLVLTYNPEYDPEDPGGEIPGDVLMGVHKFRVVTIDDERWEQITETVLVGKQTHRFATEVGIGGLEPGSHSFILRAYNGDFENTRADTFQIGFEL